MSDWIPKVSEGVSEDDPISSLNVGQVMGPLIKESNTEEEEGLEEKKEFSFEQIILMESV